MTDSRDSAKPSGLALVPFAVFAAFYVGLSLYADHLGFEMPWYKVSMPVAFLVRRSRYTRAAWASRT